MTINRFLTLHKIKLQPGIREACNYGLEYMTHASDPLHNHTHPQRLLDDLHLMRLQSREVHWSRINFNVLLMAICWHDVWVSRINPKNKKRIAFGRLYEGIGSMRVLNKISKKLLLDPVIVKKVKYAIRKHSYFQFMPRLTIEAKILHDLDKLDEWSVKRLYCGLGPTRNLLSFTPGMVRLYKFYLIHIMLRKNPQNYTFSWSKTQFVSRRKEFVREVSIIIQDTVRLLLHPQPTASSLLVDKN